MTQHHEAIDEKDASPDLLREPASVRVEPLTHDDHQEIERRTAVAMNTIRLILGGTIPGHINELFIRAEEARKYRKEKGLQPDYTLL